VRENLKQAREAEGLTQQAEDSQQKQLALNEWKEANRKLLHYQAEAYFALVKLLEANGFIDEETGKAE